MIKIEQRIIQFVNFDIFILQFFYIIIYQRISLFSIFYRISFPTAENKIEQADQKFSIIKTFLLIEFSLSSCYSTSPINISILMGQTIWCYDCCWFAQYHCVGCSWACCCFSCWCCQPDNLKMFRPQDCCLCGGANHGFGNTCICFGHYWCIPQWLYQYSIREQIGDKRPNLGDIQLINTTDYALYSGRELGRNDPNASINPIVNGQIYQPVLR